jgi:ent-kaurene synthase
VVLNKEADLYVVFADPFYQYSEDKFTNSLKGYLKDVGAILELYKASQVIIHPEESILVKQSSWTRNLLKQDSPPFELYADKLRIYVDNEVFFLSQIPFIQNLTPLRIQYIYGCWIEIRWSIF